MSLQESRVTAPFVPTDADGEASATQLTLWRNGVSCRRSRTSLAMALTSIALERTFVGVDGRSLPEARLASLYDAPEFGGETTMRAKVIRELIDEIRRLRHELQ